MRRLVTIYVFIIWLLLPVTGLGQSEYRLKQNESTLKVSGTSTVHDWEMNAEEFSCTVGLLAHTSNPKTLIHFKCVSNSIKSKHALMNKKTSEALKADENPTIEFFSDQLPFKIQPNSTVSDSIVGKLKIAGKEKEMILPFHSTIESNGEIALKGKIDINMNEFNIEPPKAMMGTIKTGEIVTIHYSFKFSNDFMTSDNSNDI